MNLEKFVGLIFVILMGLIIFIFVLSPQPKYQDSITVSYTHLRAHETV